MKGPGGGPPPGAWGGAAAKGRRRTRLLLGAALLALSALLLCGCTHRERKGGGRPEPYEIEDVLTLPQTLSGYAARAGGPLSLSPSCRDSLLAAFRERYFRPWTVESPLYDPLETQEGMRDLAAAKWYGQNRRRVEPAFLARVLDSCALEAFPSRNERAIAVLPAHLRGLPTLLPLFAKLGDYPFDQLEYPQMKLNEPLRVLHATRDGVWLFVETPYSCGWVDARAVACVDDTVASCWLHRELLVVVGDFEKVPDGRGGGIRAKIGTLLPLAGSEAGEWRVLVASADDNRRGVARVVSLPSQAALPFPIPFDAAGVVLLGDQLAGQPYGWGEMYGLRDCSAMLRDFFLPFGIWLPRTSTDQIASVPQLDLGGMSPREKEEILKARGLPFLTLLFKPGHVMLYLGCDEGGRPLVFHSAWSLRLNDGGGDRVHYVGKAVVTTLEPGRELGLVPGSTLLDRITALGTITGRCLPE